MARRKTDSTDAAEPQPVTDNTADDEDYETLLRRTIGRLKQAVFDPDTPPRDLAALTRRLMEFERELERLREEGNGGPGDIEEGADEEDFDPEADI